MATTRSSRKTVSKAKKSKAGKAPKTQQVRRVPVQGRGASASAEEAPLFRPLVSLRRQLDDLLEDVTSHWPHFRMPRVEWPSPSAIEKSAQIVRFDISESANAVTVTAELPGLEEKDVDIIVEDGALTIKGEKKSEREEKGDNFYLSERQFGTFSRSIRLPHGVDVDRIGAHFDRGVLTVTLPKTAPAQSERRRIRISS